MIVEEINESKNLKYKITLNPLDSKGWEDTKKLFVEAKVKVYGKDRVFKGVIELE